tara:strand:- start:80 stop:247 length:168 start_codon:yes stop_codon:yes gene_type:complete
LNLILIKKNTIYLFLTEIYGPGINMMVDYTRVLKMEDARLGFGPSQSLWGKVAKY